MNKKISIYQFFALMTIFPYGTASLFFIVPKAKQDAWIALLFYSLVGILLQIMYLTLYSKYPKDTLITYMPKIYGKFLGTFFSVIYISYFTYIGSRVLRDYLELITSFSLQHISFLLLSVVLMIPITFGLFKGLYNIASLCELCFIIILFIKILTIILLISTKDAIKLSNLKPVLSEGFIPLIKNSWHLMLFPYGETVFCTMIYPLVIEDKKIKKFAILSIIFEGILLAISSILFIATLGVNFATLTNFPLLSSYRIIQISSFLSRFDILFILAFMLGGFFKEILLLYISILGASQLFKIKNIKFLSIPFVITVIILSQIIAKNYPEHIHIGLETVVNYIHLPMQIIIPAITLVIYYIKYFIKKAHSK